MKFINVPISVEARKGVPRRIRWGRRTYVVRRLLDYWILQTRWWAREEKRVYFRVETDQGVMEVYRGERKEGDGSSDEDRGSKGERDGGAGRRNERGGGEGRRDQRDARDASNERGPAKRAHPPFIEGDTHTRELRQTESPYRPDAAALAGRRLGTSDPPSTNQKFQASGNSRGASSNSGVPGRWVLSKVID